MTRMESSHEECLCVSIGIEEEVQAGLLGFSQYTISTWHKSG
jgi:hypothetical protein